MKTNPFADWGSHRLAIAGLVTAPFLFPAPFVFAQGGLAPSGAPAPTMKTLDQVEARTPISSLPFVINTPGSYYLTQNLNVTAGDGINVTVSTVTLDLSGFTISSTASPAAGTGIRLSKAGGNFDVTIFNGHVTGGVTYSGGIYSGSGFIIGIGGSNNQPTNARVSGVSVSGCQSDGIYLGTGQGGNVVESCMVFTVGGIGISATIVARSQALQCSDGIFAALTASDCVGYATNFGTGVYAQTANGCHGTSDNGSGVVAATANNCIGKSLGSNSGLSAGTAQNCHGTSNDGPGIGAGSAINCRGAGEPGISADTANGCNGTSNNSPAISARSASHCYGVSSANRGISAEVAVGCYGVSNGGSFGIFANSIANSCYGFSNSGTGLRAIIAIGCIGATITGIPVSATNKYNMP